MDIDWPRTIGTGGLTLAVLMAVYVADRLEATSLGEPSAGPWVLTGGVLGVALGVLIANAFLAG